MFSEKFRIVCFLRFRAIILFLFPGKVEAKLMECQQKKIWIKLP